MNPGKLFGLFALLLAPLVWPARAQDAPGELRVEALHVPFAADWRRGPAEQENEDDVFVLDPAAEAGKDAPQVVLMRRAPPIRGDAGAYYDKLTRYWRGHYGKAVLIDRLDAGGVSWLYLRRPTRENGMGLFQLSTVHEGRAYSLLVFVPGSVTSLPAPVMDLLAAMRFGQDAAGVADAAPVSAPSPAVEAPPAVRWVRVRTYRFNLSGDALEAVVAADVDHLGEDGMLTGYGLDYGEAGVDWFMEGFTWKTVDGRVTRVPWSTRGRLEVDAPAELGAASPWTVRLILPDGETGLAARLAVWDLCGPAEAVDEVLNRLNRGARGPMERLAAARWAGCPAPAASPSPPRLPGEAGKTASATWTLPLVEGGDGTPAPDGGAGSKRVRLVEALVEPAAERVTPGDGLLERARLFFAYEPR